jgi:hypothetical protein
MGHGAAGAGAVVPCYDLAMEARSYDQQFETVACSGSPLVPATTHVNERELLLVAGVDLLRALELICARRASRRGESGGRQ